MNKRQEKTHIRHCREQKSLETGIEVAIIVDKKDEMYNLPNTRVYNKNNQRI